MASNHPPARILPYGFCIPPSALVLRRACCSTGNLNLSTAKVLACLAGSSLDLEGKTLLGSPQFWYLYARLARSFSTWQRHPHMLLSPCGPTPGDDHVAVAHYDCLGVLTRIYDHEFSPLPFITRVFFNIITRNTKWMSSCVLQRFPDSPTRISRSSHIIPETITPAPSLGCT